jgi:nucleoside-diphosphate kinase
LTLMQTTLVLVKPDGVHRRLSGEILARIERKGLELIAGRLFTIDRELAGRHYEEHVGKPFYEDLVSFITSGPVLALAVRGPDAVSVVRTLMGPTNPVDAPPGTIRGDFGIEITQNLVHGSDSEASAKRELSLFFPDL